MGTFARGAGGGEGVTSGAGAACFVAAWRFRKATYAPTPLPLPNAVELTNIKRATSRTRDERRCAPRIQKAGTPRLRRRVL
jgi:hypothetical protein